MKQQLYIYILMIFLASVSLVARSQPTAQSDLEHYHSKMGRVKQNQYEDSLRLHQLLSTPIEKFITDYLEGGFTAEGTGFLLHHYCNLSSFDEKEAIIAQCCDMAAKHGDRRLKRLTDLLKAELTDGHDTYERKMELMEDLIRRCRKAGDQYLETYTLDRMFKSSFYGNQHARCFEYGTRLVDALDAIDDDYPFKYFGYSEVGRVYFLYKDYDRSIYYMKKGIANDLNMTADMTALNHLAVYYQMKGDLDSAAYYHRLILTDMNNPIHLQIAICNLGKIYQEKGDIDGAITLLRAGLDNMKKDWAIYDFIYGVYTSLGECMLAKGDLPAVRECINEAKNGIFDYQDMVKTKRLKAIYALESKYYSRIGRQDMADMYLDSALVMAKKYEEIAGKDVILLGEKRLKEAKIDRQEEHILHQRNIILFVLVILSIISAGLFLFVYLYRKRNAAYKALAIKAEEWAINTTELSASNPCVEITQEDRHIMSLLEREMQNHVYREAGLTSEMLADRLDVHRNALSHAVNRITDGNVKNYINGFRIKEAVRIISRTSRKDLYIDELYERVGFGNRSSFSRIFKQFTGLAPLEFQKQGGANPKITKI